MCKKPIPVVRSHSSPIGPHKGQGTRRPRLRRQIRFSRALVLRRAGAGHSPGSRPAIRRVWPLCEGRAGPSCLDAFDMDASETNNKHESVYILIHTVSDSVTFSVRINQRY